MKVRQVGGPGLLLDITHLPEEGLEMETFLNLTRKPLIHYQLKQRLTVQAQDWIKNSGLKSPGKVLKFLGPRLHPRPLSQDFFV